MGNVSVFSPARLNIRGVKNLDDFVASITTEMKKINAPT